MGTFNCKVRLDSMDGQRSVEIDALVDTGASYSIVPSAILRRLGVEPTDRHRVTLADGRRVTYDLGQAHATIDGRSTPTWVFFGEDDGPPLLGAYTLEGLRLAVDPYERKLVPSVATA